MSEHEAISIREYSRQRGCSDTAVRKAIKAGKIVRGVIDRDTKRPRIIPAIADQEWAENTNPNYERQTRSGGTAAPVSPPPAPGIDRPPATGVQRSLAETKRLHAEIKLQQDALELKRKKGELVDKRAVYAALFGAGQTIKNQVLGVADRTIDEILAAPSRNDAHTILYKALVESLQSLADTNAIKLPD